MFEENRAMSNRFSRGLRVALHLSLACLVASEGELPDEARLARQRVSGVNVVSGVVKRDAIFEQDGTLEALWENEARLAREETARLLQVNGGSLTPFPTRAPIAGLSAAPSTEPTPAAAPSNDPATNLSQLPTISTLPSLSPASTGRPTSSQSPSSIGTESLRPTEDPTCLMGGTLAEYLIRVLSPITDPALLQDPSTPQGQAFNFMLNDPLVQATPCSYATLEQRYGLATFYYSTQGDDWTVNTGWLSGTPECSWFGLICTDNVRATNLTLAVNNVNGPIPNEISTLYKLDRMELFGNLLSSTIPAGMANLSTVCVLDLEQNSLTGPAFPEDVLAMTSLKQVFFSRNMLTGTLPEGISAWTDLQDFWVAENNLNGAIPQSIGSLTNLRTLIMYENDLNGAIPEAIGALTLISNLQLYKNVLESPIPDALYGLTQLSVLLLDNNFLQGTISPDIANLNQLTDLRINNNFFEGSLPGEIGSLTGLQFFTAGVNFLTGVIPNVFGDMTILETLDLSGSFHVGPIPDSTFGLPALSRLYLNTNGLTGTIPATFAETPQLIDLFLNNNFLNGTFPDIEAGQLPNLNEIMIQFNDLTGVIPPNVCLLRTEGLLDRFFADCGGATPQVECDFPTCCNRCFEGDPPSRRRRTQVLGPEQQQDMLMVERWPAQMEKHMRDRGKHRKQEQQLSAQHQEQES